MEPRCTCPYEKSGLAGQELQFYNALLTALAERGEVVTIAGIQRKAVSTEIWRDYAKRTMQGMEKGTFSRLRAECLELVSRFIKRERE